MYIQTICLHILRIMYHSTNKNIGALSQQTYNNKLISLIRPIIGISKYKNIFNQSLSK